MKLMFASDIHGSRSACEAMLNAYKAEGAERLILLGDLLYHGPRNNLPDEYDPKGVIALLNGVKNELFCVRGNWRRRRSIRWCSSSRSWQITPSLFDGRTAFHYPRPLFNLDNLPPHKPGDLLIHGHTHVLTVQGKGRHDLHQPRFRRSAEENHPKSYMIYENGVFTIKTLTGDVILTHKLQ